jgi:spermidine synthase
VESPYSCLNVRPGYSSGGRILWINREQHSYIDLDNPAHLEWEYTQTFGDVADVAWPGSGRLDALHVGGGGFTMPRYLQAVRPGSASTVLELDPGVVRIGREQLGQRTSARLEVRQGDARIGIRTVPSNSIDFVVGDAFSDLTVPWHLTTREFVAEIDRTLRPDGVYVMNVIDEAPFRFLRAEIATLRERFEWVTAMSATSTFTGGFADNVVLAASHRALDRRALAERIRDQGYVMLSGSRLTRFTGGAEVLTDDYAPVDQWLSNAD